MRAGEACMCRWVPVLCEHAHSPAILTHQAVDNRHDFLAVARCELPTRAEIVLTIHNYQRIRALRVDAPRHRQHSRFFRPVEFFHLPYHLITFPFHSHRRRKTECMRQRGTEMGSDRAFARSVQVRYPNSGRFTAQCALMNTWVYRNKIAGKVCTTNTIAPKRVVVCTILAIWLHYMCVRERTLSTHL